MKLPTVKISVVDGVAYVDQVPPGFSVEVTDYDVDPRTPERDETGKPCSRYTVSGQPIPDTPPPSSEGINPYAEWVPKWRAKATASQCA